MDLADLIPFTTALAAGLAAWDLLRSKSLRRLKAVTELLVDSSSEAQKLRTLNEALFLRYYRGAFFLDPRWIPFTAGMMLLASAGLITSTLILTWSALTPNGRATLSSFGLVALLGAVGYLVAVKKMDSFARVRVVKKLEAAEKELIQSYLGDKTPNEGKEP